MRFSSMPYYSSPQIYGYLGRFYDPNLQRWLNQDPIQEAGGINLYQFVGNDPINAIDLFGLSDKDVSQITAISQLSIMQMTANGERINPVFNDASTLLPWNKNRKGCSAQADTTLGALLNHHKYDDEWRFSHVAVIHPSLIPFHQFIIAKSENPNDPRLLIDPYNNSITVIQPGQRYFGIGLWSDGYDVPAGGKGPMSGEYMNFITGEHTSF